MRYTQPTQRGVISQVTWMEMPEIQNRFPKRKTKTFTWENSGADLRKRKGVLRVGNKPKPHPAVTVA